MLSQTSVINLKQGSKISYINTIFYSNNRQLPIILQDTFLDDVNPTIYRLLF